ncbi:MAG: peptidoglycan DD-metalloendopeptidase family protein [Gammaproteobacteria bacterium]
MRLYGYLAKISISRLLIGRHWRLTLALMFFQIAWGWSVNASAKKLYQYRDAQGQWHYSDRSPGAIADVKVSQLKAEHQQRVWLMSKDTEGKQAFYVRNGYPGPVEIEISLVHPQNIGSQPELPARFTVMPGNSKPLLHLFPLNAYRISSYQLKFRYIIGSPEARHDESVIYLPPFDCQEHFQVTQGFNGKMSHQDAQNRYAVDIAMPVGTPVMAARGGVVLEVENDFYESGMTSSNLTRANNIRILHDDGSIAVYAHLQLESAQVYPGLNVTAGQLIGYSGNTGFSGGPHLHFAVQVNRGMELKSVPFIFAGPDRTIVEPLPGMWLNGIGKIK